MSERPREEKVPSPQKGEGQPIGDQSRQGPGGEMAKGGRKSAKDYSFTIQSFSLPNTPPSSSSFTLLPREREREVGRVKGGKKEGKGPT